MVVFKRAQHSAAVAHRREELTDERSVPTCLRQVRVYTQSACAHDIRQSEFVPPKWAACATSHCAHGTARANNYMRPVHRSDRNASVSQRERKNTTGRKHQHAQKFTMTSGLHAKLCVRIAAPFALWRRRSLCVFVGGCGGVRLCEWM